MENHDKYLHHTPHSSSSTTSAIDLSTKSVPPSPALEPSDSTLARRRSWGNRNRPGSGRRIGSSGSLDPVHLDLDSSAELHTSPRRLSPTRPSMSQQAQDPFYSPNDPSRAHPYATDPARQYGARTNVDPYASDMYSVPLAGPSMSTLMGNQSRGQFEHDMDDGHREDDEAHLTANMSHAGMADDDEGDGRGHRRSPRFGRGDPEQDGDATPRSRRRTLRYSVSPSPLKKTETAMKSVTKNFRRMSLRVVNLANTGLEGQLRLGDGEGTSKSKKSGTEDDSDDEDGPPIPDLKKVLPIRGRTLGCLGPQSRIRRALFEFLIHPYVYSASPIYRSLLT